LGVQTEVRDELLRAGEPREVINCGDDRHGDDGVDTGNGHELGNDRVGERLAGEIGLDELELMPWKSS